MGPEVKARVSRRSGLMRDQALAAFGRSKVQRAFAFMNRMLFDDVIVAAESVDKRPFCIIRKLRFAPSQYFLYLRITVRHELHQQIWSQAP